MIITLYMAMSANGMIARENGEEDFLSDESWKIFSKLVKEYSCLVVGRKAYETVKGWNEGYGFDDFTDAEKIIVSHNDAFPADKGYTLACSPQEAVEKLSAKGFQRMLVVGGSTLNSSFAKAGLLDEMILHVEPVFVGKGIPLFAPDDFDLQLSLVSSETTKSGGLLLRYRIDKK